MITGNDLTGAKSALAFAVAAARAVAAVAFSTSRRELDFMQLVIVISHSGRSAETVAKGDKSQRVGAPNPFADLGLLSASLTPVRSVNHQQTVMLIRRTSCDVCMI